VTATLDKLREARYLSTLDLKSEQLLADSPLPGESITVFTEYSVQTKNEFSSVQETSDIIMITMFVCATLTNGIIMAQLLYYWNMDIKDKENIRKHKKKS